MADSGHTEFCEKLLLDEYICMDEYICIQFHTILQHGQTTDNNCKKVSAYNLVHVQTSSAAMTTASSFSLHSAQTVISTICWLFPHCVTVWSADWKTTDYLLLNNSISEVIIDTLMLLSCKCNSKCICWILNLLYSFYLCICPGQASWRQCYQSMWKVWMMVDLSSKQVFSPLGDNIFRGHQMRDQQEVKVIWQKAPHGGGPFPG